MKISKELKLLLSEIELSEEDQMSFLDNFMECETKFGFYGKSFWGYLCFLNEKLKYYFAVKRTESFVEYLNRLYPPEEKTPTEE